MSLVGMQMTSPKLQEEPVASSDNGNDTVVAVDDVSSSGPDTIDAAWGDDVGQFDDDDALLLVLSDRALEPAQDDMLFGTSGGDLVFGFAGTDHIIAGAGADVAGASAANVFGIGAAGWDVLFGQDDDDDLFGGDADDLLDGEPGWDEFVFGPAAAADDVIHDLEPGDKVDLSGFDAHDRASDNDTFTLEGRQATTAPAQIAVTQETSIDDEYSIGSGNTPGDDAAGNHALTADDFNL